MTETELYQGLGLSRPEQIGHITPAELTENERVIAETRFGILCGGKGPVSRLEWEIVSREILEFRRVCRLKEEPQMIMSWNK